MSVELASYRDEFLLVMYMNHLRESSIINTFHVIKTILTSRLPGFAREEGGREGDGGRGGGEGGRGGRGGREGGREGDGRGAREGEGEGGREGREES